MDGPLSGGAGFFGGLLIPSASITRPRRYGRTSHRTLVMVPSFAVRNASRRRRAAALMGRSWLSQPSAERNSGGMRTRTGDCPEAGPWRIPFHGKNLRVNRRDDTLRTPVV